MPWCSGLNHFMRAPSGGSPFVKIHMFFHTIESGLPSVIAIHNFFGGGSNNVFSLSNFSTNSLLPLPEGPATITLAGCRIMFPTVYENVCNVLLLLLHPYVYNVCLSPIYTQFWLQWIRRCRVLCLFDNDRCYLLYHTLNSTYNRSFWLDYQWNIPRKKALLSSSIFKWRTVLGTLEVILVPVGMFIQFVTKCPAQYLADCTHRWVVMNVWIRCEDKMAARCLTLVPAQTPLVALRILMDFKVLYRVGSIRGRPLGLSEARKTDE